METINTNAKQKILDTVIDVMQQNQDIQKLTNRQIAKKAGVNAALINYYFKSKDNLLLEAVCICMENMYEDIIEKTSQEVDPVVRLKALIKEIFHLGYTHYPLVKITIMSELESGSIITNKILLPVLNEIFKQNKSMYEIKILAAQLLLPLQIIFLNTEGYQKYLQCDIRSDIAQQDKLIDVVLKNLLLDSGAK